MGVRKPSCQNKAFLTTIPKAAQFSFKKKNLQCKGHYRENCAHFWSKQCQNYD